MIERDVGVSMESHGVDDDDDGDDDELTGLQGDDSELAMSASDSVQSNHCDVIDPVTTLSTTSTSRSRDHVSSCSEEHDSAAAEFELFFRSTFPTDSDRTQPADGSDCEFYFESDHVALKNNEDYRRLLRTFVTLESQRRAALSDLDWLMALQHAALGDPWSFVKRLGRGEDVFRPSVRASTITPLPLIAWERYTDDVEAVLASLGTHRGPGSSTRLKQKRQLITGICDYNPSPAAASIPTSGARGETYNQAWSVEEQQLLERLLDKYPPERFEARRFAKIAADMPGRTTQQVTSRVQKYFIKLAKAGLPVPGRTPSLAAHGGRWMSGRLHGHHHRHNHFYFPHSTFLTSVTPPVYMTEEDDDQLYVDDDVMYDEVLMGRPCGRDDKIPAHLRQSEEYRELVTLTALRQARLHESRSGPDTGPASVQCPDSVESLVTGGTDELRSSHVDVDYTSQSTGVTSYLDPNYMPAI